MGLVLQDVDKIVAREIYLKEINLAFVPGSRNVVLGRTLAGKTSLLRIMAGLDKPSRGRVLVDDRDVTRVSVRKRSISMVYQQFINYPSLDIFNNIASPLKLAGYKKDDIKRRVTNVARMLHIENLLDRLPSELSGGQQQRTAIARALVKESQLLLLDEPLVNLDYKLREELRKELQQIFEQRKAIVVYTTTEPTEALMLGGNLVVMDEGRVLQTGPTPDVFRQPATTRVAEIFSDPPINFIDGKVNENHAVIGRAIRFPLNGHLARLPVGDFRFGVRCNHLFLKPCSADDVAIKAVVELSEINGSETFIHVSHDDTRLVVQDDGVHQLKIGSEISIYVNPGHLFVYDVQGDLVASPDASRHQ